MRKYNMIFRKAVNREYSETDGSRLHIALSLKETLPIAVHTVCIKTVHTRKSPSIFEKSEKSKAIFAYNGTTTEHVYIGAVFVTN